MRHQAFYCPSCGTGLDIDIDIDVARAPGARQVSCDCCHETLLLMEERVTCHTHPPDPPDPEAPAPEVVPYPPPDATLLSFETARFEMSVIEQHVPEALPDVFTHLELSHERFALIYLRITDSHGRTLPRDPAPALRALCTSLEDSGDPGLAANMALSTLSRKGFTDRLECAVLLFEPCTMTVTLYNAGCRDSILWCSHEEGRAIEPPVVHDPLERRMLREARDHFSNNPPLWLAWGDTCVLVSAGLSGRGSGAFWQGTHALLEVLNRHLGEDPLRVVTLAKNAFWARRAGSPEGPAYDPPSGDVKIAAVRAVPRPLREELPGPGRVEALRTRRFELALLVEPWDHVRLIPLSEDRHALVWLSPAGPPLPQEAFAEACAAVVAVLDREVHGDNENPRQAGRDACRATGLGPERARLLVLHLSDRYERAKYFCSGWKLPLCLGPRGIRSDGQQHFDSGGEATVRAGGRLFFPGSLPYEGEIATGEALPALWPGGKASRLYEALWDHWKTKRPERALQKLILAALSDRPLPDLSGLLLLDAGTAGPRL